MSRRVKKPESKVELLNKLNKQRNAEEGIFDTFADALTFAACVGIAKEEYKPFTEQDEPINYDVFQNDSIKEAVIYTIAFAENKNLKIFADKSYDERLEIFEFYANGGLEIIQEKINQSTSTLEAFITLVSEFEKEGSQDEVDFENLIDDIEGN